MLKQKNLGVIYPTTKYEVNLTTSQAGSDRQHHGHDSANVITTSIGGGLSMIGVVFIVVSYSKLVKYKAGGTTAQRILLYISVGMLSAFCRS